LIEWHPEVIRRDYFRFKRKAIFSEAKKLMRMQTIKDRSSSPEKLKLYKNPTFIKKQMDIEKAVNVIKESIASLSSSITPTIKSSQPGILELTFRRKIHPE
jgi:hypothetical protein